MKTIEKRELKMKKELLRKIQKEMFPFSPAGSIDPRRVDKKTKFKGFVVKPNHFIINDNTILTVSGDGWSATEYQFKNQTWKVADDSDMICVYRVKLLEKYVKIKEDLESPPLNPFITTRPFAVCERPKIPSYLDGYARRKKINYFLPTAVPGFYNKIEIEYNGDSPQPWHVSSSYEHFTAAKAEEEKQKITFCLSEKEILLLEEYKKERQKFI